jgi:hypothetical protein
MEKLKTRASARKDGRLVEILGCGSSDVMGKDRTQQMDVIKQNRPILFTLKGSALKFHQSARPRGPERGSADESIFSHLPTEGRSFWEIYNELRTRSYL